MRRYCTNSLVAKHCYFDYILNRCTISVVFRLKGCFHECCALAACRRVATSHQQYRITLTTFPVSFSFQFVTPPITTACQLHSTLRLPKISCFIYFCSKNWKIKNSVLKQTKIIYFKSENERYKLFF